MNTPKVSVIVPVYNGEKVLERCLESITGQHFTDMEIIVVDDGSGDGTWTLLKRLAAKDPRIRPVRQKNQGVSAARNAALDIARGTYVRFVDSDDRLTDNAIAPMTDRLDETNADLIIGGYRETIGIHSKDRNLAARNDCMSISAFLDWMYPKSNSFYIGVLWNKLFRRDVIEKGHIRFADGIQWGEDFRFVMDYLSETRMVAFSDMVVYNYIRRPDSTTPRQMLHSMLHPIAYCRLKHGHYQSLKNAYIAHNAYDRNSRRLWVFLFGFTLID